jgi:hypothetical protein
MDTNVAPSYAILFMDRLKCKSLENYHLKPLYYGWFINNISICFEYGIDVNYMNSKHERHHGKHEIHHGAQP